ncbi:conjugative transposon TraM protein [Chitinophaga niastensis]|uniref:Conjugative transposon TraM protein n=1 Tax=Chitinophaga niastensis TaxID=536980 RepID=A0A2P8H9A4_CHINA|nr:conjugative transposon protein TraM [Chitinophaga niastensis]PSL42816.1 conjugative transposon TraM protein [Chitinophaga niastensis]
MQANTLSVIGKVNWTKVLPVLIFFTTIITYYLFSFATFIKHSTQQDSTSKSAFNVKMPSPTLDEKYKNKLDVYMQAKRDSQLLKKEKEKDANTAGIDLKDDYLPVSQLPVSTIKKTAVKHTLPVAMDENERKVSDKLDRLYKELQRSPDTIPVHSIKEQPLTPLNSPEIEQLEKLMTAISSPQTGDPEMKQLSSMLDKIIQIQNPSGAVNKNAQLSVDKPFTANVSLSPGTDMKTTVSIDADNGFFGLASDHPDTVKSRHPGISAVIHDDQTVTDGATVKLRLLQDVYINSNLIPQNSFIYGECSLGKQRLNIVIKNAIVDNSILPVKLTAYDTDGLEGIFVPGAVSREISKQALNNAVQSLELYSPDPSIASQAATVGVQAAKSFIGKKAKAISVTLKANHNVILYNPQYN